MSEQRSSIFTMACVIAFGGLVAGVLVFWRQFIASHSMLKNGKPTGWCKKLIWHFSVSRSGMKKIKLLRPMHFFKESIGTRKRHTFLSKHLSEISGIPNINSSDASWPPSGSERKSQNRQIQLLGQNLEKQGLAYFSPVRVFFDSVGLPRRIYPDRSGSGPDLVRSP